LEDGGQIRRCARLRKQLRLCFGATIPRYQQAYTVLKPFAEEMDLEKYCDIYEINDTDLTELMSDTSESEISDTESLRGLKLLAARFHTARKFFLCCLMALDAHGGKPDFLRWSTAVDEIHGVAAVTAEAAERLHRILSEEESR
jgi:hypothetical protein